MEKNTVPQNNSNNRNSDIPESIKALARFFDINQAEEKDGVTVFKSTLPTNVDPTNKPVVTPEYDENTIWLID